MAKTHTVAVEINQQQAQLIARLVAEGGFGSDVAEAIRMGFVRFCEAHPELLSPPGPQPGGTDHERA